MIWVIAAIFGLILIAEIAANWWAVRVILSVIDMAPPFNVEPHPPCEMGEPISFPTTHGLTLRGSVYRQIDRPSRGLIIFCHELGGNHWSALSYCEGLWEAGFDILAFDFRNQGESDALPGYEPLHWLTWYEVQDVLSAIRYARQDEQLGQMPLGLFGISRGGGAALAAGALTPCVRCVACEGAFAMEDVVWHHGQRWMTLYANPYLMALVPDWHIRATMRLACWLNQFRRRCRYPNLDRLLARLRDKPVLLISGAEDKYIFPEIARSLLQKTGHDESSLWVVPEAKHNMARHVAPEAYDARLVEFFFDALVAAPELAEASESQPAR